MKIIKIITLGILLLHSITSYSQITYKSEKVTIKTKKNLVTTIDSLSYAMGLNLAKQFETNLEEIDEAVFIQGFLNGKNNVDLLMNSDEKAIRDFLTTYFKEKQERQLEEEHGEAKKKHEDFLADNKTKKGVKTTESGLQYIVLKEGEGASPTKTSRVKVHYHGTLIDGNVFDSSVDRGEPTEFGVSQVIKGWTEGLQLMKIGSKYKFFIPQELAYGARQTGPKIKPYSALIFEVELLEIK